MTKTNIQKHIRPRKENNITHHISYKKFFQMKNMTYVISTEKERKKFKMRINDHVNKITYIC